MMTKRRFLLVFLLGMAICGSFNAALRHLGAPDQYPLVGPNGLPPWKTARPNGRYRSLFRREPENFGDFRPVFNAARTWRLDRTARAYDPSELAERRAAFVYTPFAAMLLLPVTGDGWTLPSAANAIHLANLVLWIVGGMMLFCIITYGKPWGISAFAVFAVVYLAFYPLADAIYLTQTQVWIWFFLVTAAFVHQRGRPAAAGVALGLAVSIKPHLIVVPALLTIVPQLRRRMITASAVTIALLGVISLAWVGLKNLADYAVNTLPSLSAGYAYYPNQSANGLLLRLGGYADPAVFNLAPRVPWVQLVSSLFGLLVLTVTAIVLRRRSDRSDDLMCFALATAGATLASPVIWMHHLTTLSIGLAVLARYIAYEDAAVPTGLQVSTLLGLLLVGSYFEGSRLSGMPLALLTGFEFYGAIMVLACLAVVTRRGAPGMLISTTSL